MLQNLTKVLRIYLHNLAPGIADREEGIKQVGYKKFVGGDFEAGGVRQFEFCKKAGLVPSDKFLDVACGSLRLGRHLIPYLDEGNYMGLDREQKLIDEGLNQEVSPEVRALKKPEFIVSDCFDFSKLSAPPRISVAFSLFTHLARKDIQLCLKNLRPKVEPGALFFASFCHTPVAFPQFFSSHSHRLFFFSEAQMRKMGTETGWSGELIEDRSALHNIFRYTAI